VTLIPAPIQQLADRLVASGTDALFGVPGSGVSLQLITALEERGVAFYGTCHEAAAAVMAGAFGRVRRNLGCCISIKGPGLANMMPGVLANAYENLPVLSLAEAYGDGPNPRAHKRLDHAATLAGAAKAWAGLASVAVVDQLVAIAREEIPGPVHLDLAPRSEGLRVAPRRSGGLQQTHEALAAIRASSRPVLIAGSLARRRCWGQELVSLPVPVLTTLAAKGLVDERGPYAAGVFTGDGKDLSPEARVLKKADLVVGLGLRNLEVLTPHTFGLPSVLIDSVPGDSWGFAGATVASGASDDFAREAMSLLVHKEWGADVVAAARKDVVERLTRDDWLPGRAFAVLQDVLPPDVRIVVDTGAFCTVAEHMWQAAVDDRFIASANGRFMGTGIPMALGAALAERYCPVICAVGDGGIRVAVGELKLALELSLPLLVAFLSDGRYGSIAGAPSAKGLSRSATLIARPSWEAPMAALGFHATRVDRICDFENAVRSWRWREGPMFIEAVFDPTRYVTMTAGVR
jgi:acetolactate synthase-1/2/3 large subunit